MTTTRTDRLIAAANRQRGRDAAKFADRSPELSGLAARQLARRLIHPDLAGTTLRHVIEGIREHRRQERRVAKVREAGDLS